MDFSKMWKNIKELGRLRAETRDAEKETKRLKLQNASKRRKKAGKAKLIDEPAGAVYE